MWRLVCLAAALITSGCNTNTHHGDTTTAPPAVSATSTGTDRTHHLACLRDQESQVTALLDAAKQKKGVILYFHGGLSGKNYMEKELGPALEQSLFAESHLQQDYFPIFINYEVDPTTWDNLISNLSEWAKSAGGKDAIGKFTAKVIPSITPNALVPEQPSTRARTFLKEAIASKGGAGVQGLVEPLSEEEEDKKIAEILQKTERAKEVGDYLVEHKGFQEVQDALQQSSNYRPQDPKVESFIPPEYGIAIARALARIALGSNHEIEPTFIEEALPLIFNVNTFAVAHWTLVKEHSKKCFSEGAPGRKLIDGLVALKQADKRFEIHTLSHSAGSIPTGELAKHLASRGAQLDSSYLIVPAVNQKDFASLYLDGKNAHPGIGKLRMAVLDLGAEQDDNLVHVYDASLLYFVSGTAEGSWYNDKMLLIAQHLDQNRKPYRWPWYRMATKEDPKRIWNYFSAHREERKYFPDDFKPAPTEYKKTASHECTKYPWVATSLAADIIREITGKESTTIPTPSNEMALKSAHSACM